LAARTAGANRRRPLLLLIVATLPAAVIGFALERKPKALFVEHERAMALEVTVAGIAAYLSVAFPMRYFHRHDFAALIPFAIYCVLFGAASLALL
jgi:undecaprenyl pyrophosphate phosphatase UppP